MKLVFTYLFIFPFLSGLYLSTAKHITNFTKNVNAGSGQEVSYTILPNNQENNVQGTAENTTVQSNIQSGHKTFYLKKGHSSLFCHFHPMSAGVYGEIAKKYESGVKMLDYRLVFPEYRDSNKMNPLEENLANYYKLQKWSRVFSKHGQKILSLEYNYEILSMTMLSFGVEKMDVPVVDSPPGCAANLTEEEKLVASLEIVMHDFYTDPDSHFKSYHGEGLWKGEYDYACFQSVQDENGYAKFVQNCCTRKKSSNKVECFEIKKGPWLELLYKVLLFVKIMFFLVGPVFLLSMINGEVIQKCDYWVDLKPGMKKFVTIKKNLGKPRPKKDLVMQGKRKYDTMKKIALNSKTEEKQVSETEEKQIKINRIKIHVNHEDLMTERQLPVGLFRYVYDNLIVCGIRRYHPFRTWLKQSIYGSWSEYFVFINLEKKKPGVKKNCKTTLIWEHVFRATGMLILMCLIPSPFYIRFILYMSSEYEEVLSRKYMMDTRNLKKNSEYKLFHWFPKPHLAFISALMVYGASFIFVGLARSINREQFDSYAYTALKDFKNIRRARCIQLIVAHLALPFEKFGILGLVLGPVYWLFALPIVLLASAFYVTPTIYLIFRFLQPTHACFLTCCCCQSTCKDKKKSESPGTKGSGESESEDEYSLTHGTKNCEEFLLLGQISPTDEQISPIDENALLQQISPSEEQNSKIERENESQCALAKIGILILKLIVKIVMVILMLSLLFMYTECFGYLIEVGFFTMMGTIINSSSAVKFIMLGFYIFVYATSCFKNHYQKYKELSEWVFDNMKEKFKDDVKKLVKVHENEQENMGFQHFDQEKKPEKLQQYKDFSEQIFNNMKEKLEGDVKQIVVNLHESKQDNMGFQNFSQYKPDNLKKPETDNNENPKNSEKQQEWFNCKYGMLRWKASSLVFFFDKNDTPRIPKKLFTKICNINFEGCPGPIYISLMRAFIQLFYLVVFLLFVLIVVMIFDTLYNVSTTNQMIVTLTGGFIPFIIRFVMKPTGKKVYLDTCTFEGKVFNIIKDYKQYWEICDLCDKVPKASDEEETKPGNDILSDRNNIDLIVYSPITNTNKKTTEKVDDPSDRITEPLVYEKKMDKVDSSVGTTEIEERFSNGKKKPILFYEEKSKALFVKRGEHNCICCGRDLCCLFKIQNTQNSGEARYRKNMCCSSKKQSYTVNE